MGDRVAHCEQIYNFIRNAVIVSDNEHTMKRKSDGIFVTIFVKIITLRPASADNVTLFSFYTMGYVVQLFILRVCKTSLSFSPFSIFECISRFRVPKYLVVARLFVYTE